MATKAPGGQVSDPQNDPARPGPGRPRRDRSAGIVIARPFGIPIQISPFMLVFGFVMVYYYANFEAGSTKDRYIVAGAFVVLLYLSVLIHEFAHCAVARGYGLPVRRILIYPLGGFSEIDGEPQTPGREALLSGAGPAVSLILAAVFFELSRVVGGTLPHQVIRQVFVANLVVGLFNLLPGLPLDGGRIFRAGVWKITGRPNTATIAAGWAGRVLALAVAAWAFTSQLGSPSRSGFNGFWLWLVVIAAFIWFQSSQVIQGAKLRDRLPALNARTLGRPALPVPSNLPLAEAIRRAQAAGARALVIADHENAPTGLVSEAAVLATPEDRRPWIEAGSLARALEPDLVLSADLTGRELLQAVQKAQATEYLLIEPTGQVAGVLAKADLDAALTSAARR